MGYRRVLSPITYVIDACGPVDISFTLSLIDMHSRPTWWDYWVPKIGHSGHYFNLTLPGLLLFPVPRAVVVASRGCSHPFSPTTPKLIEAAQAGERGATRVHDGLHTS